jgi:hypothetical protein
MSYNEDSDSWVAVGENSNLVMGAASLDVLIERCNLGLSDLLEKNDIETEFRLIPYKTEVHYGCMGTDC